MKNHTAIYTSPQIPYLAPKLGAKMLSANQIAGFFSVITQERNEKKKSRGKNLISCMNINLKKFSRS